MNGFGLAFDKKGHAPGYMFDKLIVFVVFKIVFRLFELLVFFVE